MKHVFAFFVVIASLGCGAGSESPAAESSAPDTLRLLGVVGEEFGDPAYTLGAIMALDFLPGGDFAVLDRAAGNIRVYSPSGEFLRSISSPGSGPGEVVQAYGMLLYPNGDFGIMDPNQGGMMRFDPQGQYLGIDFEIHHNIPLNMTMVGDSGYAGSRTAIHDEGGTSSLETFIGHFPMQWEPDHKYLSFTGPLDMATVSGFLMETMLQCPWAVDPATGTVYAAPYSDGEFRIKVLHLFDSPPPGEIALDIPPVEKTPEEITAEREYYAALFNVMEGGEPVYDVNCDPFPLRHPVRAMDVDDAGRLWVLRGDLDEPLFMVFAGSGELLGSFAAPDLPSGEQLVFRVHGGVMIVYSEDPEDYQKVWILEVPAPQVAPAP